MIPQARCTSNSFVRPNHTFSVHVVSQEKLETGLCICVVTFSKSRKPLGKFLMDFQVALAFGDNVN